MLVAIHAIRISTTSRCTACAYADTSGVERSHHWRGAIQCALFEFWLFGLRQFIFLQQRYATGGEAAGTCTGFIVLVGADIEIQILSDQITGRAFTLEEAYAHVDVGWTG